MPESSYVRVRATAGAKHEVVLEEAPDLWRITVREKPTQGAANRRIRELLAAHLGVSASSVRLVKGAQSPSKVYLVYRKGMN